MNWRVLRKKEEACGLNRFARGQISPTPPAWERRIGRSRLPARGRRKKHDAKHSLRADLGDNYDPGQDKHKLGEALARN